MENQTDSAEAYIVDRYKLWGAWQTRYGYKHTKGARLASIIKNTGGDTPIALEIGVGPGGVAAAISRTGIKVIGMDLSPDALVRAKEHCATERVALMRASGFAVPFADAALPLVYASQVLHLFNAPGRLAIMREAHRILRPGGRFVFDMKNMLSHPSRYFTSDVSRRQRNFPPVSEIMRLLREAGFSKVETMPGVLPLLGARVPNLGILSGIAHTRFYIAYR